MRIRSVLGAATVAGAVAVIATGPGVLAAGTPADKVSASGSETEVVGANNHVVLLSEKIRTSTTADLMLQATAECAITTELTTTGNDTANAIGTVKMYVTIDGTPVPISTENTDVGRAVFCNRAERRDTTNFDDEDATIDTYHDARQANAFNWMALNVGNGIHTVELHAEFATDSSANGSAMAAVGNRTLIIEPTHAANREEVSDLSS